MYEFYVADKDRLVLTQYDYRNEDLTMKEQPESIVQELDIKFINDDKVKLSHEGQTVEMKRKNTTANKTNENSTQRVAEMLLVLNDGYNLK